MIPAKERFLIILEIICCILFLLFKLCLTKSEVRYQITNYHMCLSADGILHTVSQVSMRQCVENCATLADCSSVIYRRSHKLCELHSTLYENFLGSAFTTGPCVFINRSNIFVDKPLVDCDFYANEENGAPNYCAGKFCPYLKLGNGALFGNMKSVGSRVEYTCSRYFAETAGKTNSVCQVNGSWTHEPICSENFIYMGCYEDRNPRILSEDKMDSSSLTTESCVIFCFELGYIYALTEFRTQCFCGNVLRDYPKVDDNECDKSCAGDSSEVCGGHWRGSLYKGIL